MTASSPHDYYATGTYRHNFTGNNNKICRVSEKKLFGWCVAIIVPLQRYDRNTIQWTAFNLFFKKKALTIIKWPTNHPIQNIRIRLVKIETLVQ